jgi:hypothetical protein
MAKPGGLSFRLLQNGKVRVSVLPGIQKSFVLRMAFDCVTGEREGLCQTEMRQRIKIAIRIESRMGENYLIFLRGPLWSLGLQVGFGPRR